MATRDEVIDAINRIELAGHACEATRAARTEILLPLPPAGYERILDRLRSEFPGIVAAPSPTRVPPAEPAPAEQQGAGVEAMQKAELVLGQQRSATAEFDRQVIEALLHAQHTTQDGRRQLDDLERQIDTAARGFDLSTAAGAREFQRFLISKLGQIVEVVEATHDDDAAKQALAAAWAALYASQADRDGPAAAASAAAAPDGEPAVPDIGTADGFEPVLASDPELLAPDDPGPAMPAPGAAAAPMVPAMPGFGAEPTGAAMPAGFPLPGLGQGLQHPPAALPFDDDPSGAFDEPIPPDDVGSDRPGDDESADPPDTAEPVPSGPTTVRLPNGETITAATPQLAAVIAAAAGGTPVSDAFRQQGITIPAPGSPVAAPIEPSRVRAGDIGMFTDRHALALGNAEALLDGQIQRIGNVAGPSFLGWQHPPTLDDPDPPVPTPTRPSAAVRA